MLPGGLLWLDLAARGLLAWLAGKPDSTSKAKP